MQQTATRRTPAPVPSSRTSTEFPGAPILEAATFDCLRSLLDAQVLASTYRDFLEQTRARLEDARRAGECDERVRHALGHTLRGTAGMLGATALAATADGFEADALSKQECAAAIERTLEGCRLLEQALREAHVAL